MNAILIGGEDFFNDFAFPNLIPDGCGNLGTGIRIFGDHNEIGQDEETGNQIQFNHDSGIQVFNAHFNSWKGNQMGSNLGKGIDLHFVSNQSIRPINHIQIRPIQMNQEEAFYSYEISGEVSNQNQIGSRIDFYLKANGDFGESLTDHEGFEYLESFLIEDAEFQYELQTQNIKPGEILLHILCDREGNCSEFSSPHLFYYDSDQDGLIDILEDKNKNLKLENQESDPFLSDSDQDGLRDGLEDRNQNGIQDPGKTISIHVHQLNMLIQKS